MFSVVLESDFSIQLQLIPLAQPKAKAKTTKRKTRWHKHMECDEIGSEAIF
ncbi:hypothetical protein ACHAC9_23025 [Massilia sp. CMS3.1]|uniref:hypothetical protein n=1 Tax=Massilia sp. CMS3.1 TaxID=3373083 RepID=UPI003EE665AB